jgi:UDP-N-acetylglucosamine--N-acetylmuramyl-(pentapeptide) pyrophosphoryl-undecaprenol N-acetylglucosamine transferase
MLKAGLSVLKGRGEAKRLYKEHRPDAVVGFGGYPAFPSLLAASSMRVPTVLHEQNAVLGRVNRLLAGEAEAIAIAYDQVDRLKSKYQGKSVVVGNPVREEVAKLGELPYPPFDEVAPLKILITGGSQGASVLSDVVPEGLGLLQPSLRHRLQVVQQCRPDDIEQVRNRYAALGIPAELMTYIEDMPDKLADAHLVIGRAGASTIAELTAAGRPAILIPFPSATDDHQTANAREMTKAGGARTIQQENFTPEVLARQIEAMAADPVALNNAAARALSVGRPHAARDLADLVERVGGGVAPIVVGPALSPRVRAAVPAGGMPA